MEDYKEKYEMALEGVQEILSSGQYSIKMSQLALRLHGIFPELKESEDEGIRKGILELVRQSSEVLDKQNQNSMIAWLEKQESVGEIVKRCKDSWYNEGKIAGMAEGLTNDERYQQGWHDALEKQGEQKTDKYEGYCEGCNNVKGCVTCVDGDQWAHYYYKDESKQEWSEEDDYNLQCMIAKVTSDIQKGNVGRNNELIDWLKSLKDRIGG